jgi:hypothetical protein
MSGVAPIEKEKRQWKKTIFFGTLTAIQLPISLSIQRKPHYLQFWRAK